MPTREIILLEECRGDVQSQRAACPDGDASRDDAEYSSDSDDELGALVYRSSEFARGIARARAAAKDGAVATKQVHGQEAVQGAAPNQGAGLLAPVVQHSYPRPDCIATLTSSRAPSSPYVCPSGQQFDARPSESSSSSQGAAGATESENTSPTIFDDEVGDNEVGVSIYKSSEAIRAFARAEATKRSVEAIEQSHTQRLAQGAATNRDVPVPFVHRPSDLVPWPGAAPPSIGCSPTQVSGSSKCYQVATYARSMLYAHSFPLDHLHQHPK